MLLSLLKMNVTMCPLVATEKTHSSLHHVNMLKQFLPQSLLCTVDLGFLFVCSDVF